MKKLFALLLALCLMCGVAGAEAEYTATSTLELSAFAFDLPEGYEFHDYNPNYPNDILVEDGYGYAFCYYCTPSGLEIPVTLEDCKIGEPEMTYTREVDGRWISFKAQTKAEAAYFRQSFYEITSTKTVEANTYNGESVFIAIGKPDEDGWYDVDLAFFDAGNLLTVKTGTNAEFYAEDEIVNELVGLMAYLRPAGMTKEEMAAQKAAEEAAKAARAAAVQEEVTGAKQTVTTKFGFSVDVPAAWAVQETASNDTVQNFTVELDDSNELTEFTLQVDTSDVTELQKAMALAGFADITTMSQAVAVSASSEHKVVGTLNGATVLTSCVTYADAYFHGMTCYGKDGLVSVKFLAFKTDYTEEQAAALFDAMVASIKHGDAALDTAAAYLPDTFAMNFGDDGIVSATLPCTFSTDVDPVSRYSADLGEESWMTTSFVTYPNAESQKVLKENLKYFKSNLGLSDVSKQKHANAFFAVKSQVPTKDELKTIKRLGTLNGVPVLMHYKDYTNARTYFVTCSFENQMLAMAFMNMQLESTGELEYAAEDFEAKILAIVETLTLAKGDEAHAFEHYTGPSAYVVITNSSANIRSGPGGDYAKVTTGRKGDTFPLIEEDGNWYIIDVDGQTGYVSKSLSAIQE